MCGITAIITPYGYDPSLDPSAGDLTPPQEPEDTLRSFTHAHLGTVPRRPTDTPTHVELEDQDPEGKPNDVLGMGYKERLVEELEQSLERISHRGPDGRGVWVSADARVGESQERACGGLLGDENRLTLLMFDSFGTREVRSFHWFFLGLER